MGIFSLGRRHDGKSLELSRSLASKVRESMALGEEDAVSINQIECGDPACAGGAETFIIVMRKGERTRASKISKSMELVTDEDIVSALAFLR